MKFLASVLMSLFFALPSLAQEHTGNVGINLADVTDWSTEQPFVDVFKTARPWIGHLPRQWGGATFEDLEQADYLDVDGWPVAIPPELSSVGTVILTDLPEDATHTKGRYRLRFEGNGIVEVGGRAQNVRYGKGEVSFDFAPGLGPVDIRIQRTDRARKGDYVRNITVVKLDHEEVFQSGGLFNPDLIDRLEGFSVLRFMDWMKTNNSTMVKWQDRPRVTHYSWAHKGVPVEIMLELANQLGADPWVTLPHLADDEFAQAFAVLVKDGLKEDRKVYVEYSNEVWNWQFSQASYADTMAQERWGARDSWLQYYAARSIEISQIWREVFGDSAKDHLVNVISSQTGWLGLEGQVFEAPLWRAENPDNPAPANFFNAYAITGYIGGGLGYADNAEMVHSWLVESLALANDDADAKGLSGAEKDAYTAQHRFDLAVAYAWDELLDGMVSDKPEGSVADYLSRMLPYHAEVAQANNLELIMYEGGTHVVGIGPSVDDDLLTEFFIHLNYSTEMGLLYEELLAGWFSSGSGVFVAFNDVMNPTKWGSWGALRHLSDTNPRWDVLEAAK
ncbi:MAG: hypothetical protein ACU0BB_17600 [Paracoccaceae bacterium]